MLKINNNNQIQMFLDHLNEPAPADFAGVINRYKALDGSLFHHIISSPQCRYERGFGEGRVPPEVLAMSAEERFKNILKNRSITGNPKSHFVNKHKNSLTPGQMDSIKSVSFALCKNSDLSKHFKARDSEYGICFYHDFLLEQGLRPVTYVNDSSDEELAHAVFASPYLVESYSNKYDMRWENEWRIRKSLDFTPDDVAFLIVPDSKYLEIYDWIENNIQEGRYIMAYIILPSSVFSNPLDYLRMVQHLQHQSWHQIRIFGGMLMQFDDFPTLTEDDRNFMRNEAGDILDCLSVAAVHEIYEERYKSRFLSFLGNLDDKTKKSALFKNITRVAENSHEPRAAVRDLVIAGYEKLFDVQCDRITSGWNLGS